MGRQRTPGTPAGERVVDGRTFRVTRLAQDPDVAADFASRTQPGQNTFDRSYQQGRFPSWVRNQGHHAQDEGDSFHQMRHEREYDLAEPRPVGYNRPREEEPYTEALAEFFETRINLMPPKSRQVLQDVKDWIHQVMHDRRPVREVAEAMGFSDHTAVVHARKRAVEQLVESCGGKAALAEKLRAFLHAKELADGQDRLKYLPRWVHE